MDGPSDRDERSAADAERVLRSDDERIAHALSRTDREARARRRHEGRWDRRMTLAFNVFALAMCLVLSVVVVRTGGAMAFVLVPMFLLLAVFFVFLIVFAGQD